MIRIRHLAIGTVNVDRLINFHTNSFGLQFVRGEDTATYLTNGNPTDLSQHEWPH
jgi:hypothetical protein